MSRELLRHRQQQRRLLKADRAFGAGAGGRSGLPSPMTGGVRQGGSQQAGIVVSQPAQAPTAVGETVCLTAAGHSVAGFVTFDAEPLWRTGFQSVSTAGATGSQHGYYAVGLSIVADGVIADGEVRVYVDEGVAVGPDQDAGMALDGCDEVGGTVHLPVSSPGQQFRVWVDPGGTSVDVVATFLLDETVAAQASQAPVMPTELPTVHGGRGEAGQFAYFSTAAPSGTQVGDLLVASSAHRTGGGTGTASAIFPAGFTPIGNVSSVARERHALAVRVADAGDAAGTTTHEWGTDGSSINGSRVTVVMSNYGPLVVQTAATTNVAFGLGGGSLIAADPGGGDFTICVGVGSRSTAGSGSETNIVFVPPGELLVSRGTGTGTDGAGARSGHGVSPADVQVEAVFESVMDRTVSVFAVGVS